MKARPILFNGPMVRALLDGTKSQTRRIIKSQPPEGESIRAGLYHPTVTDRHGEEGPGDEVYGAYTTDGEWALPCPYGQPGDQLWVRESCWIYGQWSQNGTRTNGKPSWHFEPIGQTVLFENPGQEALAFWGGGHGYSFRPSIHMPRWVSRILLEIVSVRVERLQDITLGDICKEGLARSIYDFRPATDGFRAWSDLWGSINGAGSWAANPWVWVVEFRRLS